MWKGTKRSKASSIKGYSLVSRYIQHFNEVSGSKTGVKKRPRLTHFEDDIPDGGNTQDDPAGFRKLLRKSRVPEAPEQQLLQVKEEQEKAQVDERLWELLMTSDARDHEKICWRFGVKDLSWAQSRLEEKRQQEGLGEKKQQKDLICPEDRRKQEHLVCPEEKKQQQGAKEHSKGGVVLGDDSQKPKLKSRGKKVAFRDLSGPSAEFKVSDVGFAVKMEEVKVQEREDAVFQCVLTQPMSKIRWMGRNVLLRSGDKYTALVSEDQLTHRLLVRDVRRADGGIYAAIAGTKSCSAWLQVAADTDLKMLGRQTEGSTSAGEAGTDLEKIAREEQMKIQQEEEMNEAIMKMIHQSSMEMENESYMTMMNESSMQMMNAPSMRATGPEAEEVMTDDEECSCISEGRMSGSNKTRDRRGATTTVGDTGITGAPAGDGRKTVSSGHMTGEAFVSSPNTAGLQLTQDDEAGVNEQRAQTRQNDVNKRRTQTRQNDDNKRRTQTRQNASDGVAGQDLETPDGLWESTDSTLNPVDSKQAAQQGARKGARKVAQQGVRKAALQAAQRQRDAQGQSGVHAGDNEAGEEDYGEEGYSEEEYNEEDYSEEEEYNEEDYGEEEEYNEELYSMKPADQHRQHVGGKSPDDVPDVAVMHPRRRRPAALVQDTQIGVGVHFLRGLSDLVCLVGETAELCCKLSAEHCEGCWFKDGNKVAPAEGVLVLQEGCIHKLVISACEEVHSGTYRFQADGRKTEASLQVKDPPRILPDDLASFQEPMRVRAGRDAIFKLHFLPGNSAQPGGEPVRIGWFLEGEELHDQEVGVGIRIERFSSHSRLLLSRLTRRTTGTLTIKLRNPHGTTEASTQLIVLDKPTSPLGPVEELESSGACVHFKWRPPKDDGGAEVTNYTLERRQVGRNTWKKLGDVPGVPVYRDTDVDLGRRYCYRIRAVTSEGISDLLETPDLQAGTLAFPSAPAPPTVVSSFKDVINLCWAPPGDSGGSRILGYMLERRKKNSNLWTLINPANELIKEKKCSVTDVVEGMQYEFRVAAINLSGPGEFSSPSEFVYARDPIKPPGKVTSVKVTETSYSHFTLSWTPPQVEEGLQDEAQGYFVELRRSEVSEWSRCNATPVRLSCYSVTGLKPMDMYWVRVVATNHGGDGPAQELDRYVLVMPAPVRPRFTDNKMKTFMVVREGNSVRININFEASPHPDIVWLKDNVPVTRRVTISNCEGWSQMLIPTAERSDSGLYSVLLRNMVGQETFSIEVHVTDDPKPPGPVELEESVPGTVTLTWAPSPDEKRDDRLHYSVTRLDSARRSWAPVAERLFNHRLTVCNVLPGRQYVFRVYACNDMGTSGPSESPSWGREKNKEKLLVSVPTQKECDLRCAPAFIVPLKQHSAPQGYECYMSCAVKGDPKPRITWFHNNVSVNTDSNFLISNTCGVCSLLILRVTTGDTGEYSVSAENSLGRALSSTVLSVRE